MIPTIRLPGAALEARGELGPVSNQRPTGEMWERLDAADLQADLEALREDAARRGYAPTGQLMQAIARQLEKF